MGPGFERGLIPDGRLISKGPRAIAVETNCVECPLAKPDACSFGAGARQTVVNSHALSGTEKEVAISHIATKKDVHEACPARPVIVEALRSPFQQEPPPPYYGHKN